MVEGFPTRLARFSDGAFTAKGEGGESAFQDLFGNSDGVTRKSLAQRVAQGDTTGAQPQRITQDRTSTGAQHLPIAQNSEQPHPSSADASHPDVARDPAKRQSVFGQFKDAFLHSAVQAPVNGATQIVDSMAGTHWKEKAQLFDAPQEARFGTLDWHVQLFGNAAGMAADFLVLRKGLKLAAGGLSKTRVASRLPLMRQGLEGFKRSSLTSSVVAGAVYDGALRESHSDGASNPAELAVERLKQASIGAATFGTMVGAGSGLRFLGQRGFLGSGLVKSALSSSVGSSIVAGVPAGLLNTELNSGFKADGEDLLKGAYTFAVTGATMGSAEWVGGRVRAKLAERAIAVSEMHARRQSAAGKQDDSKKESADWRQNASRKESAAEADALPESTARAGLVAESLGKMNRLFNLSWRSRQWAPDQGVTLFLDGGGVNGWRHIGVLKAIEELGVKVDDVYTVSIGTPVGALFKRGYSAAQIEQIFSREFKSALVVDTLPKKPGLRAFFRRANAEPMVEHWVSEYGLQPETGLHIGTYYAAKRRMHWFEGSDYSMVDAIRASMGIPGVFRGLKFAPETVGLDSSAKPVTLLDGGIRRVTARDLPEGRPTIISRLHGPGETTLQNHTVSNRLLHWLEKKTNNLLRRGMDAPDGDAVVIYPEKHEVNSLAFKQPEEVYQALVTDGYQQTLKTLGPAIDSGQIPSMIRMPAIFANWTPVNPLSWHGQFAPVRAVHALKDYVIKMGQPQIQDLKSNPADS